MKQSRTKLALALVLALALPATYGCSSGQEQGDADAAEKEETVVLTDEDVELTDEDTAEAEDDAEAEEQEAEPAATTQRVGAEGIGFVDIPQSWMEFHDVDGNSSLQWCDGTPYTIISLNTFDLSSVPEDQRAGFTTEDAANSVWANILNDGVDEDAIQGARVTLAGREALQVYALYPDGSFLVCWLLEDDQGTIRYVAAEGTEDTIMDAVDYVQNSYEL